VVICGEVPHAGHSLANELICLPHLEHGIKAIERSANCADFVTNCNWIGKRSRNGQYEAWPTTKTSKERKIPRPQMLVRRKHWPI
jgi:hypothetical protein